MSTTRTVVASAVCAGGLVLLGPAAADASAFHAHNWATGAAFAGTGQAVAGSTPVTVARTGDGGNSGDGGSATSTNTAQSGASGASGASGSTGNNAAGACLAFCVASATSGNSGNTGNTGNTGPATNTSTTTGGNTGNGGDTGSAVSTGSSTNAATTGPAATTGGYGHWLLLSRSGSVTGTADAGSAPHTVAVTGNGGNSGDGGVATSTNTAQSGPSGDTGNSGSTGHNRAGDLGGWHHSGAAGQRVLDHRRQLRQRRQHRQRDLGRHLVQRRDDGFQHHRGLTSHTSGPPTCAIQVGGPLKCSAETGAGSDELNQNRIRTDVSSAPPRRARLRCPGTSGSSRRGRRPGWRNAGCTSAGCRPPATRCR